MRILGLLFLFILFAGCGGTKQGSLMVKEKDSIVTKVTEIKRQEIVTVPGDSIKLRIPILDLSDTPIVKKSERATASVRKVGSNIEVDCKCEQYQAQIEVMDKLIETQRELLRLTQETKIQEVRVVPWYHKILSTIGAIALILGGVLAGIKIGKRTIIPI